MSRGQGQEFGLQCLGLAVRCPAFEKPASALPWKTGPGSGAAVTVHCLLHQGSAARPFSADRMFVAPSCCSAPLRNISICVCVGEDIDTAICWPPAHPICKRSLVVDPTAAYARAVLTQAAKDAGDLSSGGCSHESLVHCALGLARGSFTPPLLHPAPHLHKRGFQQKSLIVWCSGTRLRSTLPLTWRYAWLINLTSIHLLVRPGHDWHAKLSCHLQMLYA